MGNGSVGSILVKEPGEAENRSTRDWDESGYLSGPALKPGSMSMGERSRKTEKPRCPIITLRYTSRQPSGPVPKEEEGLTP